MGEPHLDREILSRFIEGRLPPEEARRVDHHLSVCTDCRDQADEISLLDRLEFLDALLNPGYDRAFERAADRTAEQLANLRQEARGTEDLLSELSREPPGLRRYRVVTEERFHSLKLCQLLQARSKENWFSNPAAALEWAELAVAVTQRLDTRRYGSSLVEDSRALAWAYVGNANRILCDLWRAEQSLQQAWLHHLQAGEDITTETELLSLTSSLRIAQNRCEEAVRLSDRAIAIYREGQQPHAEGAALIQKGFALTTANRCEESLQVIHSGLTRLNADNPQILLNGKLNLAACLLKIGSEKAALRILRESRRLLSSIKEPLTSANLRWLEGSIAEARGQLGPAEAAMLEVKEFFVERQSGREVFKVSLDLAHILLREERRREARECLSVSIPLGEQMGGSPQELLAARLLYAQASKG